MTGRIFAITTYHEPGKAVEAAEEWKRLEICAIGWSPINLSTYKSKEAIRQQLEKEEYDTRRVEDPWKFKNEMSNGDLVIAYSKNNTIAYVGEVQGPCEFHQDNSIGNPRGEFQYPNQRKVKWCSEPHHFSRHDLPKHYSTQFGKRGVTVAEIIPESKGSSRFIKIIKACANSGSKLPGISEGAVKAGLVKYLYHTIDSLEKGLTIKSAEITIGRKKRKRPDFIAEDINERTVIIECKGTAGEDTVDQILGYGEKYGDKNQPRLMIVAFRINSQCRLAAKKVGNIELFECDLNFHKIE